MRTTIKDIAKATGLSITTVSLVLNEKPHRISRETCKLIEETAKRLDYHPNKFAVGLIKKVTNTIGLIIPDISNVFFSEITKGIEDILHKDGYNLILCNSNDRHRLEVAAINMLNTQTVDGLIMVMSSETYGDKEAESISSLKKMDTHTVLVDCFNETGGFSTVCIDNFKASYMAIEYLLTLGHHQIACISGPLGLKTNNDRLQGYTAALKKYGIAYDSGLIYEGDFHYQSGYDAVPVLLPKKPSAILCLNDMMAYGAMKALKEQGIIVPQEISVMGFDDIFFSQITEVPLTTIRQPAYQMGAKAAELLLQEIAGHIPAQHVVFEPAIKIRKSTRKIML
ncbi:transcriptional regulator [Megasphaera cerevisiae DSM 20462]|jgi:LacI family transcriptional regulator|uniref:Transcriptional regulator n=1 Tax=Megasphaera cerevisiae DSM 20462 TaxID=1122219 RepID=A0A0J6WXX0_9FIRM|nr:LacI family DNA-binding transcriptional regulator [Megasphaera cerevisiae]KMO87063.1 transcriptional regulator [Megasphaera cerevisiae DSM 20462]OKY52758.1 LacI family transcriptional regulator [Megasphaera cerevisiae]SJZ77540.1 transcriptional regulator, LacI family [Megasphaera cerevisiae DSM 20462]